MNHEIFAVLRIVFAGLFLVTLLAGVYLALNYRRLFGVDPRIPSENASARAYSKVQVFSVWAHAVCLTGAFALLLR